MKIKFFPVGTLFAFVLFLFFFIPLVYANKVVINK